MNQLEKLIQEHAIYKKFFDEFMDRPMNEPGKPFISQQDRIRLEAFNVLDNIRRLNRGIVYYDATWGDADKVLFTTDIQSLYVDKG